MKLTALLLLAWPLCAQTEDWDATWQRYLKAMSQSPASDAARLLLQELEPWRLPAAARLRRAEELAALWPESAVLKAALAKALCANGQQARALRILEDPGFSRRDVDLQQSRASAWAECGQPGQGAAGLADLVQTAVSTKDAVRALRALLNLPHRGSELGVVAALKRQWRGQVDSGSKELRTHRLLAEVYSWARDPALVPLCENAIRLFPQEMVFFDLLAERLILLEDWPAVEALRLGQLQALQNVSSQDYLLLVEAYVLSGRLDQGLERLRAGLADARLDPADKVGLEDKIVVLEAMERSRLSEPQAPACDFTDEDGDLVVDCGGRRLGYSLETGRFTGQDDPARAVPLACRLMERVEEERFSERAERPAMGHEVREMLKAAGYLDR
ncbi:MAG: hypothetical protein NTY77_01555 [Elusimicrobia bacterium]|nr:hypothetical protein [Elusimicrobiota bacterium]